MDAETGMQEMSLGMYLQCRQNLSHKEATEVQKMMEEIKNDPWKPYRVCCATRHFHNSCMVRER